MDVGFDARFVIQVSKQNTEIRERKKRGMKR